MSKYSAPVVVPDDALPLFVDVETAAKLIGIGRSAAYEAIRQGELPAVKFGRRLRVPRGALLALAGVVQGGGHVDR